MNGVINESDDHHQVDPGFASYEYIIYNKYSEIKKEETFGIKNWTLIYFRNCFHEIVLNDLSLLEKPFCQLKGLKQLGKKVYIQIIIIYI